jgi:hypothetical protein
MNYELGTLRKLPLRDVWPREASDFTPWLSEHLEHLGETLGMDLALESTEADVGNFSLDILARDLNSGETVVIENQLTQTDHDHLGKLLTYAAGFDSKAAIWLAPEIREEHRQALDWLNQRTGEDTQFFGVAVEVVRIDDSKPAVQFNPLVFPNQWQKAQHRRATSVSSSKEEAYRTFFQKLIDDLRDKHRLTNARQAGGNNYFSFSAGVTGLSYVVSFAHGGRARAEIYIDVGSAEENKALLDEMLNQKDETEAAFGAPLEWERLENRRAARIASYREGSITDDPATLDKIHDWFIESLLKLKATVDPQLHSAWSRIRS